MIPTTKIQIFINTDLALLSIPQASGKYRYTKQVTMCPDNQCVYYSFHTFSISNWLNCAAVYFLYL